MENVNKMKLSWNDKKKHLIRLVKEVSDAFGGDETVWLTNYTADLIKRFANRLDEAIVCFESVHPEYQRLRYLALWK